MVHPLDPLFAPASVALVGASERAGSIGAAVLARLREGGFHGPIRLVNPRHTQLAGERCYATLEELPEAVDLAVVTAPAAQVPGIVQQAKVARTRALAVLSAGFGESGAAGIALQGDVVREVRSAGIALLGPNCVGILRPSIGLNASFARSSAPAGGIALVSQSGAICTALVDWAAGKNLGLSSVVSLGDAASLDFGDLLDYLLYDPQTTSVLLYVEGVKNGRRFVGALRALARAKPVVALKVGRYAAASKAASSHTGALVGNDAVFDAVLARCGVVRVGTCEELFAAAVALGSRLALRGSRVAIVTNGGGPGALAADAAVGAGLEIAPLALATMALLDAALPAHWSHGNPVDIVGDANGDRFAAAVSAVAADPSVDAVVTAYAPTAVSSAEDVAAKLVEASSDLPKPLHTSWLGQANVWRARLFATERGVAAYKDVEGAVRAIAAVARWKANQELLLQAPRAVRSSRAPERSPAAAIFKRAVDEGRRVLTEMESKSILAMWGIPVTEGAVAGTREEACAQAGRIGFPVALKILSRDITHKSDVNGVRLGLANAAAVASAFDDVTGAVRRLRPDARIDGVVVQQMVERTDAREVFLGVTTDPVFGPAISFGSGGTAVELLNDNAIALPPLDTRLAEDLIARTRVSRLLGAWRNVPAANAEALVQTLLAVSDLACELPWISEMDLNPLLVDAKGVIALDARIVIDPSRAARDATWSHLAIHPYPAHLEHVANLRDGRTARIRPIRPDDAVMEMAFITALSDGARYTRFLSLVRHVTPEMVARFTQIDYDRDLALVAVHDGPDGANAIVGVARYVHESDGRTAEFAIVVADAWQGCGLATILMRDIEHAAREAGIKSLSGFVLRSNGPMRALMDSLGYRIDLIAADGAMCTATKDLAATSLPVPTPERMTS